MTRHFAAQHEAHTAQMVALTRIEHAAAVATVAEYGVDGIWIAPTRAGATARASLCLSRGFAPSLVCDALARWSWSA
jgi:hypothetical protein